MKVFEQKLTVSQDEKVGEGASQWEVELEDHKRYKLSDFKPMIL